MIRCLSRDSSHVEAVVIGLYFACLAYILFTKRSDVAAIEGAPEGRELDFGKIEKAH